METKTEIKDKIRQYIIEETFSSPELVKDESKIFEEGLFDSMGFILLINFIEENFSIKAKDSELLESNFESVNAIAEYVIKKKSLLSQV
ncbi:MAG: acyl carrier protein [Bacteroidetes bacterium]|nr:acyl carrier protein [Bacteroidota bacterium]MBS1633461.1 acyl carrier protein [Bacteroidota bacterium]